MPAVPVGMAIQNRLDPYGMKSITKCHCFYSRNDPAGQRRNIVNISAGTRLRPLPLMSAYNTSKSRCRVLPRSSARKIIRNRIKQGTIHQIGGRQIQDFAPCLSLIGRQLLYRGGGGKISSGFGPGGLPGSCFISLRCRALDENI